jgi:formylglycine-generating enzyme required for sulfatase activity
VASLPKVQIDLPPQPSKFKGDSLPIDQVSWEEAIEFCERLSSMYSTE